MLEAEIIKEKKRNIYSSFISNNYSYKFFFKSILHHVISLEVYENNQNGISFEGICSSIPKLIGSRSSIQSILNEALEKNIFNKYQSKKDKRIKNYYLADDFSLMINNWLKTEQSFFIKSNGSNLNL